MRTLNSIVAIATTLLEPPKPSPEIEWIEINKEVKTTYERYNIPKTIWIYWHSSQLPKTVEICINQARRLCPDFSIIVTDRETIKNYIDIPNITTELPEANIADYIRLALLDKYGGVWMDASILITENLSWIISRMHDQDAFLFFSDECTLNKEKPISENWFIACPKGSDFIRDWLCEFKDCITSDNPKDYYSSLPNRDTLLQNITNPNYLLCHISAIVVLETKKPKILYASAASTGHLLNYKHKWGKTQIAIELLIKNKNKVTTPKLVQITVGARGRIESLIKKGIYTPKSLLGEHIKSLSHSRHQVIDPQ